MPQKSTPSEPPQGTNPGLFMIAVMIAHGLAKAVTGIGLFRRAKGNSRRKTEP